MEFEWDADKAAANAAKHGVAFTEAMTVFGDPLELAIVDPDHSEGELRFLSIGLSAAGRLLVVAYTEREGRTRIITPGRQLPENGNNMNRQVHHDDNDEMRPEYDFSQGVRGKHYAGYRAGTNVVFLDPDVARVFTDSTSVNQVLRLLLRLAKTNVPAETKRDKALQPRNRRRQRDKQSRAAKGRRSQC